MTYIAPAMVDFEVFVQGLNITPAMVDFEVFVQVLHRVH